MNDQATSLRKLKQMVDLSSGSQEETPEQFLTGITRPSPFSSVALIIPDMPDVSFPPVNSWISGLMNHSPRACFWDQAELTAKGSIPQTQVRLRYPVPVRLDSGLTPLTILPHQPDFTGLSSKPVGERIDFLHHLSRCLKNSSELWISIKASELARNNAILHSTDAVCIMVPNHPDAIFKCYETVKSVHLSGYFSPIGLLDFSPARSALEENSSKKIKIVAKQFLALDLVTSGMVLSNCTYIPPENEAGLRGRITAVEEGSRDFLYCLSESLIYLIPGIF